MMDEITVEELKQKIESGDSNLFILDVREPFEQYQSKIDYEESKLIPLDRIPGEIEKLKKYKGREIVCLCRTGSRSAKATDLLKDEGFDNVKNLQGGINEWARKIDDNMPVY